MSMSTSTAFRPLNSNETFAIGSALAKCKIPFDHPLADPNLMASVSYENMQGGFCVCIIVIPAYPHRLVLRGASRRSYKDPRKPIRGEMLAFSRAILYSRPVELL